jgi:glutaredoxin
MSKALLHLVAVILLALSCAATGGTMYKSIGPDGRVVYSDRPPDSGRVEKSLTYKDLPASPLPDAVLQYREALQKSADKRLENSGAAPSGTVQLFAAAWCGHCRKAKAWLAGKGIAYQEHDIDTPEGKLAFAQTPKRSGGIPLLTWKGEQVQGFSPGAYDAFFSRSR